MDSEKEIRNDIIEHLNDFGIFDIKSEATGYSYAFGVEKMVRVDLLVKIKGTDLQFCIEIKDDRCKNYSHSNHVRQAVNYRYSVFDDNPVLFCALALHSNMYLKTECNGNGINRLGSLSASLSLPYVAIERNKHNSYLKFSIGGKLRVYKTFFSSKLNVNFNGLNSMIGVKSKTNRILPLVKYIKRYELFHYGVSLTELREMCDKIVLDLVSKNKKRYSFLLGFNINIFSTYKSFYLEKDFNRIDGKSDYEMDTIIHEKLPIMDSALEYITDQINKDDNIIKEIKEIKSRFIIID